MTWIHWLVVGAGACSLAMVVWTFFGWQQLIGAAMRHVTAGVHTNPLCARFIAGSREGNSAGTWCWYATRTPTAKETIQAFGLALLPGVSLVLLVAGLMNLGWHLVEQWLRGAFRRPVERC